MLTNKTILDEIHARRQRTRERLQEMFIPAPLEALLPEAQQIREQDVASLTQELVQSLGLWCQPEYTGASGDEIYAACGFEWYYDGREVPYPLGFGYTGLSPEPSASTVSDKLWVRDDYLAGAELAGCVFPDTGSFNFKAVCGTFFDFVTGGQFDTEEYEECSDLIENLFLLKLLETLQRAALVAAQSDEFAALKKKDSFYLVARNHDNEGFIFASFER